MRQFLASVSCTVRLAARPALLAASLALASFSLLATPAAAQSDDAQLQPSNDSGSAVPTAPAIAVRLGFGGMAKIGNWLPVAVQVSNEGSTVSGELQIQIDDSSGGIRPRAGFAMRPPTVYSVPASLPSHSHKQFQIDIFLPFLTKDVTVKLMTDQGVLVQQTANLQVLSGSEVLCGTLSNNQNFFQQLKNLDLPGRQGKKPFIVPLKPEDIPARQHAMSSLDCLIVDNISLTGLTDDQKTSLLGWVEDGGLLVLGGGSGWQKTLQPLPKELLPVDVTGVRTVPSLQPLADFAHQPFKGEGPWLVAAGTVRNGTAVAQINGVPLLVGARQGKGTVIYLAADPTAEPLNTWNGNASLWKYILAYNSTPLAVYPFFSSFGGFSTVQNWGQPPRQALFNMSDADPPSSRWLFIFIGVYTLIAGPLNYLALRLAGAKALAWFTIPMFIGGAAYISYHIAHGYVGSDLVLNEISIIRSDGNSAQANMRSYISLYSPRKADYTITVPGSTSVTSFAQPFSGAMPQVGPIGASSNPDPWQLKVTEGDSTGYVAMPLEVSSTGSLLADSQVRLPGKVEANLKVQGDAITGTIANHTGQDLDRVVLALGSDAQSLGRLRNGQKTDVHFTFTPGAASSGPDAQKVKNALTSDGSSEDPSRNNIIDAFLGSNSSAPPAGLSGLMLLGWMPRSPLPVRVQGLHPSLIQNNLYVTPLRVDFQRGANITIPQALIETKQIGAFSTNYGPRNGQYELNPAGSVAIEFTLPVNAGDLLTDKLTLHMNGHYAGNTRFISQPTPGSSLGQIFLYNWSTSDWDPQDFAWGDNPIPDAGPYLSATNTLRVRYTYKPPATRATASLQFTLDLTAEGQLR
jgi:hypothetical protein